MFTFTLFAVFFLLALMGVPLAISLALGGIIPLVLFTDIEPIVCIQRFFAALDSYGLLAAPFYIISGGFLDKGGVSKRLVRLANALVGWLPGGLAVVTFLSCAFFGAISGSSAATVVAIGSIMVPAMIREGYPTGFALATIASAGWLGIIVPPSVPMVLYGTSANASVGEVFMGGFIPGFLLAFGMSAYAIMWGSKHKDTIKTQRFQLKEAFLALKDSIWALLMPLLILGGIYGGVFTPTEAAAVSIIYGLFVGFVIYKELDIKTLIEIMRGGVKTTSIIMLCIAAASLFGYVMAMEMIPQSIANFIVGLASTKAQFWALITILLLIVGTFMDTPPAILILTPIIVPMLSNYGISETLFGVVMIVNLGIGLLTPPVGLNLYISTNLLKVPVTKVLNIHLVWYIILAVSLLIIFMACPGIIEFLPRLMFR